jgi:hypothetical protein
MVKRTALAVVKPAAPVALVDRLDFEQASPSVVLPALAFELHKLAQGIEGLGDLSVEMELTPSSCSLKFRAYKARKSF